MAGHLAQLIDKQAKNIKALALLRHARARDGDEHASLGWVRVLNQFCFCALARFCSVNVTGHLAQLIDKQAKNIKALALLRHARVREWFPRRQLSAVSRKTIPSVTKMRGCIETEGQSRVHIVFNIANGPFPTTNGVVEHELDLCESDNGAKFLFSLKRILGAQPQTFQIFR